MRSMLDFFRRGLMIEVFHLDAKTPSVNEILTRLVMIGRILSMHSFRSLVGRASNSHDLVFILKMIFLTSVWVNGLNSVRLGMLFPHGLVYCIFSDVVSDFQDFICKEISELVGQDLILCVIWEWFLHLWPSHLPAVWTPGKHHPLRLQKLQPPRESLEMCAFTTQKNFPYLRRNGFSTDRPVLPISTQIPQKKKSHAIHLASS